MSEGRLVLVYFLLLRRHSNNDWITHIHEPVEEVMHCTTLWTFPGMVYVIFSSKFSVRFTAFLTCQSHRQRCEFDDVFTMHQHSMERGWNVIPFAEVHVLLKSFLAQFPNLFLMDGISRCKCTSDDIQFWLKHCWNPTYGSCFFCTRKRFPHNISCVGVSKSSFTLLINKQGPTLSQMLAWQQQSFPQQCVYHLFTLNAFNSCLYAMCSNVSKVLRPKWWGEAPYCKRSSEIGGKGPSLLAISGPLLSQIVQQVVFLLVRADTTFPSTIVMSPLKAMAIFGSSLASKSCRYTYIGISSCFHHAYSRRGCSPLVMIVLNRCQVFIPRSLTSFLLTYLFYHVYLRR